MQKVSGAMSLPPEMLQEWLAAYLRRHGAVAGTVHVREGEGLRLAAAANIPPPVADAVRWVPWGKGMAGLALERGRPVQTCNLKEDASGQVKPGARAVNAQAAVAMPLKNEAGAVTAVLGVAFAEEREISETEVDGLLADTADLPLGKTPS